jgi:hypothetical protein
MPVAENEERRRGHFRNRLHRRMPGESTIESAEAQKSYCPMQLERSRNKTETIDATEARSVS